MRSFPVSGVVSRNRIFHSGLDHFSIKTNILLNRLEANGEMVRKHKWYAGTGNNEPACL
jgi:hypothetical protein